jgi:hypothetical protein
VIADAAFASWTLAVSLLVRGWHFVGQVKTAHKNFPKATLKNISLPKRGDCAAYQSDFEDKGTLTASVWNEPGKGKKARKLGLSTCCTTERVDDVQRWLERKNKTTGDFELRDIRVPCNEIAEMYFDNFSSIDQHNRVRQAGFALERNIIVHLWIKRVILSMIGFVCAGANPSP